MTPYRPSPVFERDYPECPGCGRDLSSLNSAVFCPGCGRQLQFRTTPREHLIRIATELVRCISHGRLFAPPPQAHVISSDRAPILIGYGKAMFKLGQRYESSGLKNWTEAMRCYRKSARLGNGEAKSRLTSDPLPVLGFTDRRT
jgi:predicted RNA-binding Zn-ribbon protein involved in translation (DUF1610 family)